MPRLHPCKPRGCAGSAPGDVPSTGTAHLGGHLQQIPKGSAGFPEAPKPVRCLNPFEFSRLRESQLYQPLKHIPIPSLSTASRRCRSGAGRPGFGAKRAGTNLHGSSAETGGSCTPGCLRLGTSGVLVFFHPSRFIAASTAMKGRSLSTKPL